MIQYPGLLQFRQFKDLYSRCFCAGAAKYVDEETKYKAYSFIENMGIKICPYCEEEYLDVIEKSEGGKVRTLELDHFFPKGDYPGLAMCFYNLVPSGQACNGIKLNNMLLRDKQNRQNLLAAAFVDLAIPVVLVQYID